MKAYLFSINYLLWIIKGIKLANEWFEPHLSPVNLKLQNNTIEETAKN